MALHDMPNPHLVNQENCLSREMKSQTKEHKYFFKYNKPLDSLCHGSRFGGYTPGFEEISFQFLSIAVKKIKQLLYIETKISAMVAPTGPTKEGPALSKVATKDDHYVP